MPDDLVSRAARKGLIDEPTVRRSLGPAPATPEQLVALGVCCSRCGRPVALDSGALACASCGIRVEVAGAERYERRRLLGQGAFGEVWLAHDRELDRDVALKFLTSASPQDLARFKREARLAAQLSHPGIVPVHDVGDRFLVMDFIPGRPAGEAALAPREAAEIVRQAAEAVAHAHAHGVIHRDLKPANILVTGAGASPVEAGERRDRTGPSSDRERTGSRGDGGRSPPGMRAFVTDFGLAKNLGTESLLSVSGDIVGTPAFMPPEQARGKLSQVGPHSDIYALGATLYALLADRPPFPGTNMFEVLAQVIDAEPPPLRADRDLEVIVRKAMSKEPSRRYASASDLAADLARYLRGEPILARPATITYRLRKRVARNPWAWTGLAAAATLTVAVGAVLAVLATREKGHKLTVESIQAIREAEVALERWLPQRYPPIHDVTPWKEELKGAERKLRRALEIDPGAFQVRATLGRVLHELGRYEEARDAFAEASRRDPASGEYRHGLAQAHLAVYEAERALVAGIADPAVRARETARIDEHRRRGLEELQAAVTRTDWRPSRAWERDLSIARILWSAGETDAAVRVCDEAGARLGEGGEEFWMLRAEMAPDDDERVRWYDRAANHARSYARAYAAAARYRAYLAFTLQTRGEETTPVYEKALEQADAALEIDPTFAAAYVSRGILLTNWGMHDAHHGRDAAPRLERAVGDLSRALELEPGTADTHLRRSKALGNWAWFKMNHGEDPAPLFTQAIEDIEHALALHRDLAETFSDRGNLRTNWAVHRMGRGEDPEPLLEAGIEDFGSALTILPDFAEAYRLRAGARVNWALHQSMSRRDPTPLLESAVADFDRAIEIDPSSARTYRGRAAALMNWASHLQDSGRDPAAQNERALADLGRALELNPGYAEAFFRRGQLRLNWGQHLRETGGDSVAQFRAAVEDLTRALGIDPRNAEAYRDRGTARAGWAQAVEERVDEAIELSQEAIRDHDRAIEIDPRNAEACFQRGAEQLLLGLRMERRGEDPRPRYEAALADLTRSTQLNPNFAPTWAHIAHARACHYEWLKKHGRLEEGLAYLRQAMEAVNRAIELDPAHGFSRLRRGVYRLVLGEFPRAIEDLEAAIRLDPSLEGQVAPYLEQARRAATEF